MEGLDEAHDVGENSLLKDLLLLYDGLLHFLLLDVVLGETLDGEEVGAKLHIFDKKDLPELSLPQLLEIDEVGEVEAHLLRLVLLFLVLGIFLILVLGQLLPVYILQYLGELAEGQAAAVAVSVFDQPIVRY